MVSRNFTQEQKIILDQILKTSNRKKLNDIVKVMTYDIVFMAKVCAEAIDNLGRDHCEIIVTEIFNVIPSEEIKNTLYFEFSRLPLSADQWEKNFIGHLRDDYPETIRLLGKCFIGIKSIKKGIAQKQIENVQVLNEIIELIITHCRRYHDYDLLHFFSLNLIIKKEYEFSYGKALIVAINDMLISKTRIEIIENLYSKAKASLNWYIDGDPCKGKTIAKVIHINHYDLLEIFVKNASPDHVSEIAEGIAYVLNDPAIDCNKALNIVNTHLNSNYRKTYIHALSSFLTQENANKAFLACMNDNLPSDKLNILLERGVSVDQQIEAIEKCINLENKKFILAHFLKEQKSPKAKGENVALKKIIDVCDIRLIEQLANDIIPGNEKAYGKALTRLMRFNPEKKDVIQKFLLAKVSFMEEIEGGFKPIHCMVYHNDYDILNSLLPSFTMNDIAINVAFIMAAINQDIVKNRNDFIKAIKKFIPLKNEQTFYNALKQQKIDSNITFLLHINDDQPSEMIAMCYRYGIDADTHIKAITECKIDNVAYFLNQFLTSNPSSDKIDSLINAVIRRCYNIQKWDLADILALNVKADNENAYGELLYYAASNNQKNTTKKLLDANASLVFFSQSDDDNKKYKLFALHYFDKNKWQDLIADWLKNDCKVIILAKSIAKILLETGDYPFTLNWLNITLDKNSCSKLFYDQLQKEITDSQANELFKKHIDDSDGSVIDILYNFNISIETFIHNFKECKSPDNHKKYLDFLLESEIDENQFASIMDIAISISQQTEKWNLVDDIASKKIQLKNTQEVYGKALFYKLSKKSACYVLDADLLIAAGASANLFFPDEIDTVMHVITRRCSLSISGITLVSNIMEISDDPLLQNTAGETTVSLALKDEKYQLAVLLQSNKTQRKLLIAQQEKQPNFNIFCKMFQNDVDSLNNILKEDSVIASEEKSHDVRMRDVLAKFIYDTVCKSKNVNDKIVRNNIQIIEELLKSNNDLKIPEPELIKLLTYKDPEGNTALHKAVMIENVELVKILLNAGADPYQINNAYKTSVALAETSRKLILVTMFKKTKKQRNGLLKYIQLNSEEITNGELLNGEKKITGIVHEALSGNLLAIQQWVLQCKKQKDFDIFFTAAAMGYIFSKSATDKSVFFTYLNFNISHQSFIYHRVKESEKIKIEALQKFYLNFLEQLNDVKNNYSDFDFFTIILLVMKQKLIGKTDDDKWELDAKDKIQLCLRSIMKDQLGMTDHQIEIEMNIKLNRIRKILKVSFDEAEQKETMKENKNVLAVFKQGDICAIQKRAQLFRETADGFSPNYPQILSAYVNGIVYGDKSERATWKILLKKLNVKKYSSRKTETLELLKDFSLHAMRVSKRLQHYFTAPDPIGMHYLVIEHAAQWKKYPPEKIKKILDKFNQSFELALIKEGGLSEAKARQFLFNKKCESDRRIEEIGIGHLPFVHDKTSLSDTDGMNITDVDSNNVLPMAVPVHSWKGEDIPPIAPPVYTPTQFSTVFVSKSHHKVTNSDSFRNSNLDKRSTNGL